MKERLSAFWESVKALWDRLSRVARIILLCAIGGVIILCLILVVILNQKEYTLLYNDLSTTESAKVLTILGEAGVTPLVQPNGAIYVEEKDVNLARMRLAQGGFPGSNIGYETYNPGLTATQSDKNRLATWQLQDRLQAAIETYEEVAQAVVNISAPEQNAFALESDVVEPSAAVMLSMRQGRELTPQQIQGILHLIEGSVPGLKAENISITDQNGDLKPGLAANADIDNNKLRLTEEVNAAARARVLSIVQPMFGPGNVEVQVSSKLDTDERVAESITYEPFDPENPTRNPVDYTQHEREKLDAPGGIAEGVPGANDNIQTPQYGEEAGAEADYATYRTSDIYDYLVSSTKEQIIKSGLDITDMKVAVTLNARTLADGQRDQIIALAANAAGVAVEDVMVVNYEFAARPGATGADGGGEPAVNWLLIGGLILLGLIILGVVIAIIITKRRKTEEEEEGEALYDEDGMPLVDLLDQEEDFEPITIVETQEQKLKAQIKDLAESDPEIVAQLIKTWLV